MTTLPGKFHKAFWGLAVVAALGVLLILGLIAAPYVVTDASTDAPEIAVVPPDRDCADFPTWEQAQAAYEAMPAPYRYDLDGDRDGIACEGLRR